MRTQFISHSLKVDRVFVRRGFLVAALLAASPAAAIRYNITELKPVAGFISSSPARLNNQGLMVGTSFDGDRYQASLWDSRTGLTPITDSFSPNSQLLAVNESGAAGGSVGGRPSYMSPDGTITILSGVSFANQDGRIGAIAENGQLGGYITIGTKTYAAVWDDQNYGATLIGAPANSMISGGGPNNMFVGLMSSPKFNFQGFVWSEINGITAISAFGTKPGPGLSYFSNARDVNFDGVVVGYASASDGERAFWWTVSGGLRDMGDLDGGRVYSRARSINDSGQVVGFGEADDGFRATLWDKYSIQPVDLNSLIEPNSGWLLEQAYDINDLGQIIGVGVNPYGQTTGFLLDPLAAVPEPATWAMFLIAFGALGVAMRSCSRLTSANVRTGATGTC